MQIAIGPGAILERLVVRPDQKKTLRRDQRIGRDLPFCRLRKIIGKIEAAEIHLSVVRII